MLPRHILLITSTIAPSKDTFLLSVSSAAERLVHYQEALKHYVALVNEGLVNHIVYVDNSAHDLTSLKKIAQDAGNEASCEFVSYKSDVDPNNSRFFLELNLIEEAIKRSKLLAELSPDTVALEGHRQIRRVQCKRDNQELSNCV